MLGRLTKWLAIAAGTLVGCNALTDVGSLREVPCVSTCDGGSTSDGRASDAPVPTDTTQQDQNPGDAPGDRSADGHPTTDATAEGDAPPPDSPPAPALSLSATTARSVIADASGSTDTDATPIATYDFDFGDGTARTGPMASSTATHTYTMAGTFTVTVTVADTGGLSSSASAPITLQPATSLSYVGRLGDVASGSSATSEIINVASPGIGANNLVVISLMLTSVADAGTPAATDSTGLNLYTSIGPGDDGAGDNLWVLTCISARALASGTITVSFPPSNEHHITVDAFSGPTTMGVPAQGGASGATFSSGPAVAGVVPALFVGAAGTESANGPPVWDAPWTPLAPVTYGGDYLGPAYLVVTSSGMHAATGDTAGGSGWMAIAIPFQ